MRASTWKEGAGRLLLGLLLAGSAAASVAGPLYLWELADAEGRPRAWLYGTLHVCDAACFPLPAAVREALAAADSLALELDPEDPALGLRLRQAALLPAGQQLDAQLPAALRARLHAALARVGLAAETLQRLQPWMVGTLLTLRVAEQAGFETGQGVDLWLARAARARGLPLWMLETVDRQVAALGAGDAAGQLASLVEVLDLIERDAAQACFRRLLAAWRRGDAAEIDRLVREEFADEALAPMLAVLLDQRNRDMAEAILARLQPGRRPFIAVGAAHLGGPHGLLAELTARGFRVRQVEEAGE